MDDDLMRSPALKHVKWFILNEIEGHALSGETEPRAICLASRATEPPRL